jgi:hypothetical protein
MKIYDLTFSCLWYYHNIHLFPNTSACPGEVLVTVDEHVDVPHRLQTYIDEELGLPKLPKPLQVYIDGEFNEKEIVNPPRGSTTQTVTHKVFCSNHGVCNADFKLCQCNDGFRGLACDYIVCPGLLSGNVECSGRGECDSKNGKCVCHEGYGGEDCSRLVLEIML